MAKRKLNKPAADKAKAIKGETRSAVAVEAIYVCKGGAFVDRKKEFKRGKTKHKKKYF